MQHQPSPPHLQLLLLRQPLFLMFLHLSISSSQVHLRSTSLVTMPRLQMLQAKLTRYLTLLTLR